MSGTEMLQKIGETLGSTATVRSVFGEPIQIEGKTVVPVARVKYGFGGGFGGPDKRGLGAGAQAEGGGGGGGGSVRACPAGALEIRAAGTRFIPFLDLRPLAVVFIAGAVLGRLTGGCR